MTKPTYNDETLNVRLPGELAVLARQKAKREKRPLSEIIRELLRHWLTAAK